MLALVASGLLAASCSTGGDNQPEFLGGITSFNGGSPLISDTNGGSAESPAGTAASDPSGWSGDQFNAYFDNPFVETSAKPISTFSVDADGASYAIVRQYLLRDYKVNPSSVRIEELLNYFTFNYAAPVGDESVAISAEVGDCPWTPGHYLLQLGIKGRELSAAEMPRANFVFLIDVSGSMDISDKLPLLKRGLKQLLHELNPDDRISIVTYSGEVKKVLSSTPVSELSTIEEAIDRLEARGATNGGKALEMAYEEALANYDPAFNNRIIMGTDGDFNLGVTTTNALVEMVENYADKGIYMTCLGFGLGNLNDAMMECVSNAGNGTYHFIDSEQEMMRVFVHERNQFVSVANDAKCQLTFNSHVVSKYRLLGYENRIMADDDFENDMKDAGEIGAGQTITALYEIVLADEKPTDMAGKDLATFDFRYKQKLGGESRALQRKIPYGRVTEKYNRPGDFYFAAGVAAYGMLLRESPYKGDATFKMAEQLVEMGLGFDPHGYRAELKSLIRKLREPDDE